MKKKLFALCFVFLMCFSMCACGSKEEKHPLVGEWYTQTIVLEDTPISREEMISTETDFYFDMVINKDLTYSCTLGGGGETITGTVKTSESSNESVYYFEEAGLAGSFDSENTEELIIIGNGLEIGDTIFVLTHEKPNS